MESISSTKTKETIDDIVIIDIYILSYAATFLDYSYIIKYDSAVVANHSECLHSPSYWYVLTDWVRRIRNKLKKENRRLAGIAVHIFIVCRYLYGSILLI